MTRISVIAIALLAGVGAGAAGDAIEEVAPSESVNGIGQFEAEVLNYLREQRGFCHRVHGTELGMFSVFQDVNGRWFWTARCLKQKPALPPPAPMIDAPRTSS